MLEMVSSVGPTYTPATLLLVAVREPLPSIVVDALIIKADRSVASIRLVPDTTIFNPSTPLFQIASLPSPANTVTSFIVSVFSAGSYWNSPPEATVTPVIPLKSLQLASVTRVSAM